MNSTLPPIQTETEMNGLNCALDLQLRLDPRQADLFAEVFRALSHPVRLQMLDLISQRDGEVCGCDIEQHFSLTQPTISHHLKVLRDCGLITSQARSVWVHHRVNGQLFDAARDLLATMRGSS